ncbi:uncharacterized protein LOC124130899 [Haliotis rufescens]|uniref:uncharacterized protein LOC124130899 n=1 Tax=Haliotis rufescens TaxID=6454 RepID=UPI00201E8DD0|nr:uncharacterized protein LOC124130899 [Haliotis rufescens]
MKLTLTKVLHYGLLLMAAYIVYTWLVQDKDKDDYDRHPRNKDKFKDSDTEVKGEGHKYADRARHVKDESQNVEDEQWVKDVKKQQPRQHAQRQQREDEHERNVDKKEEYEDKRKRNEKYTRNDKKEPAEYREQEKRKEDNRRQERNDPDLIPDIEPKLVKDLEPKVEPKVEPKKVMEIVMDDSFDGGQANRDGKKEEVKKMKWKGKEEDGEDMLKDLNDAALKGDPDVHKQIDRIGDHKNVKIPKLQKGFGDDHDDLNTAADKIRRRKEFFEKVSKYQSRVEVKEDKHIHETEDDFAFVTAANSDTYGGALRFIYSVQFNFPKADIGIFDIGLSQQEASYIRELCSVELMPNILTLYPEHILEKQDEKFWRPIVLDSALNRFGHFVFVEPMRFMKKGVDLRGHFALSRKGGAAMFGPLKSYSTAVVTNPEMYYYLAIDVRKMLRLQHVEINMMIMHNSAHLKHFFTRWLVQCALEEYCMAPPGSQKKCNLNLYPKSNKYANCHRYDESAINLLLASWHNYDIDHYAAHDIVTSYFDGRDVARLLKVCNLLPKEL